MTKRSTAAIAAAILVLAACSPSRTAPTRAPASSTAASAGEVVVILTDAMRMEPAKLTARVGVPVTFRITNTGQIEHEFYIGSEAEQTAHDAEMLAGPMHDHANGVSLLAGETRSLTHTFGEAGTVLAGCHVPGHYGAGMVAEIVVTP